MTWKKMMNKDQNYQKTEKKEQTGKRHFALCPDNLFEGYQI